MSLHVEDIMTNRLVTVGPNEDLSQAYDLMIENQFRHLPVVDDDGALLGILSDRDLISAALYAGNDLPGSMVRDLLRERKVEEVMTRDIETVGPGDDVRDVGSSLLDSKLSSFPVVRGTELVGILTESDFVRYLVKNGEAI